MGQAKERLDEGKDAHLGQGCDLQADQSRTEATELGAFGFQSFHSAFKLGSGTLQKDQMVK